MNFNPNLSFFEKRTKKGQKGAALKSIFLSCRRRKSVLWDVKGNRVPWQDCLALVIDVEVRDNDKLASTMSYHQLQFSLAIRVFLQVVRYFCSVLL